jgi:hypothetical protein
VPAAWKRHYDEFAVKTAAKQAITAWGVATQRLRGLPDFLIIGAQRAGTTSLYEYLTAHPAVVGAMPSKGVHYFDTEFARGTGWYRGHFPGVVKERYVRRRHGQMLTGEASPYYLFHPEVPARVAAVLPRIKLIALLRDPVERAYSQYANELARRFEHLSFEEALDAEEQRLAGESEQLRADPGYVSFSHQHHSYVSRGFYLEQLERWEAFFPEDQLLVLDSSRLFANPAAVLRDVQSFLGLEPHGLRSYPVANARARDGIRPETRQRLSTLFAEPNRRLFCHLGIDFGWNRE